MIEITTERLPIHIWAEPGDLAGYDSAIAQARNLANHPLARERICLMPDFHVGYGMPIGGVLATEGGVVPNAVGVDIGCGMIAARTSLEAASLDRDMLERIRQAIHARVPVGPNHHRKRQDREILRRTEADTTFRTGSPIVELNLEAVAFQIGTLGSGNHFIEVQRDEDGFAWVMLHSGSRNIGTQVCNHYEKLAKGVMKAEGVVLADPDLAYLAEGTDPYDAYLREMNWCLEFAEDNRQLMFERVLEAFVAVRRVELPVEEVIDTHHNFAALEAHFGRELLVHRKGAVKAEGPLTIPGSMGTASYICEGLGSEDSFRTCSHGAGRVLGRKEANRRISHEEAVASVAHVVFGVRRGDYDEMPAAYKDIDRVIANQLDLVRPLHRLEPMAVVKG